MHKYTRALIKDFRKTAHSDHPELTEREKTRYGQVDGEVMEKRFKDLMPEPVTIRGINTDDDKIIYTDESGKPHTERIEVTGFYLVGEKQGEHYVRGESIPGRQRREREAKEHAYT